MYMSTVTECDNFEEKTLFLLYFGDRVIAPVKCCLTYIYPFIADYDHELVEIAILTQ